MLELEIIRPTLIASGKTSRITKCKGFRLFDNNLEKLQQQTQKSLFEFMTTILNYQK